MELRYVPRAEFDRIRSLEGDRYERTAAFADACRLNVLYMVQRVGSGHLGTTFSSLDIVTWLHLEVLGQGDRYFSSKGHDAPGLYALLTALGRLDFDLIHQLRRLDGLPGHPDVAATPEVVTSTGSLGMGISKARGFVLADRLLGRTGRVYVLTGDGELQEGQIWESLQPTANRRLEEITVIVDRNEVQSDTWVSEVSDLGDLEAKFEAFGWALGSCDGNDVRSLAETLEGLRAEKRPKLVIATTRKGAGVSFMEAQGHLPVTDTALYAYHVGAPPPEEYERAVEEVRARLDGRLARLGAGPVELVAAEPPEHLAAAPQHRQQLVATYGQALAEHAEREPRLVALDADLRKDCGLVDFRERFPERYFQCGIAEQDMVSQAGAMALAGLLPVVHSFACFLSTRPNEQIYNNATEGTKVIYVGSLAGLVPGGPGHSHQSVRDISALGAVPGMALIEPFSEHEARAAVDWAVNRAPASVYIRLVSVGWAVGFEPPAVDELVPGRGTVLRAGGDALFVAAGPVMVGGAWHAADLLEAEGIEAGVVSLPWLRGVDGAWIAEVADGAPVFCLDNHYVTGGQGDAVVAALAAKAPDAASRVHQLGIEEVPRSGENNEVLRAHRLDGKSIAEAARARLRGPAVGVLSGVRVLFWDIDGTLLTTKRAGVFALEEAAREVCGTAPDFAALETAGLTDHEVAVLAIRECGGSDPAGTASAFLRAYERHLPDRLGLREGGPLPGVLEILDSLAGRPDVISLLLTGNTAAGAKAKLEHYGLARYFAGGAFCSDGDDRPQIARRALSVAAEHAGGPVDPKSIFVIGDTPHDVRCGNEIQARAVAVASGSYSLDQLTAHEPWLALERLPSPARFIELLMLDR